MGNRELDYNEGLTTVVTPPAWREVVEWAKAAGFELDRRDCNFYSSNPAQWINREIFLLAERAYAEGYAEGRQDLRFEPERLVSWTGCGGCDRSFPCHDGADVCIRHPAAAPRHQEGPAPADSTEWLTGCPGCGMDNGLHTEGCDEAPMSREEALERAEEVFGLLLQHNWVLTIELVPREPLAMGNYAPRIDVRPTRVPA